MYTKRISFLIFVIIQMLFIAFVLSCSPSSRMIPTRHHKGIDADSNVRILIYKTKDAVSISSSDKMKIYESNGNYKIIPEYKRVLIQPEHFRKPLYVESWNEIIQVNGKRYRGKISLHNVAGTVYVINILRLNEYLYGVVPMEMPAEWPMEALKAQAIVSRTFALYHIAQQKNILYDMDSTTSFQVYQGFDVERESTNKAVDDTNGIILVYEHKPILSFFHSTCGGKTVDDRYVWQNTDLPYLTSVRCGYCDQSPNYEWEYMLSLSEIRKALQQRFPEMRTINSITLRKNDGRVSNVMINHNRGIANLSGNDFRILISPDKIKSLAFEVEKNGRTLRIFGHGWGHGVGLCQWGARGMAEQNKNYVAILKHYYKGVSIKSLDIKRNTFSTSRHTRFN